jgi:hypothetical protein
VENIWTMSVSLIQQCFMGDEGVCCKTLSDKNDSDKSYRQEVLANTCASSCGKTGGASSIHSYWA